MRLATALLLAAVPALAMAQPKPTAHGSSQEHKAAHHKRAEHKPGRHKPVAHKPVPTKLAPTKPVKAKPPAAKPPVTKPAVPKPPAPPTTQEPPNPHKGSTSGLALPRFASLKTDDVNFRRGPGTRYPIEWIYKRRGLPVEIEREFEVWRLVVDPEGTKGWVHTVTLTSRRTAVVTGAERVLRASGSDTAGPVAKLERGVIVRVRSCAARSDWCQVELGEYRGFIRRSEIWGVLPGETIP